MQALDGDDSRFRVDREIRVGWACLAQSERLQHPDRLSVLALLFHAVGGFVAGLEAGRGEDAIPNEREHAIRYRVRPILLRGQQALAIFLRVEHLADEILVIVPGRDLTLRDGRIQVRPRRERSRRHNLAHPVHVPEHGLVRREPRGEWSKSPRPVE